MIFLKKIFNKSKAINNNNKEVNKTKNRKSFKNENAQGLVEFALLLPVLLMLILGMIEYGWLLNAKITVTSAAREGARVAVVTEEANREAEAQTAVTTSLSGSGVTVKPPVLVVSDGSATNLTVTVTGTVKPIVGLYVQDDFEIKSASTMRIE